MSKSGCGNCSGCGQFCDYPECMPGATPAKTAGNPGHYDEYPELTRLWTVDGFDAPLVETPATLQQPSSQPITDTARIDFHVKHDTTWYAPKTQGRDGTLCFTLSTHRLEVYARTWRDAVDAAIKQVEKTSA